MMQTTLDDVCMMVLRSAMQYYTVLGLFRMFLQSYLKKLLRLTQKMSYMNIFKTRANKIIFKVIFVYSPPRYYRLGSFKSVTILLLTYCRFYCCHACN